MSYQTPQHIFHAGGTSDLGRLYEDDLLYHIVGECIHDIHEVWCYAVIPRAGDRIAIGKYAVFCRPL